MATIDLSTFDYASYDYEKMDLHLIDLLTKCNETFDPTKKMKLKNQYNKEMVMHMTIRENDPFVKAHMKELKQKLLDMRLARMSVKH